MDETTLENLRKNLKALKSLHKSTERSLATGHVAGTGKLVIRSYENLHARIRDLLPDDDFIESLTLEIDESMGDKEIAGQVLFVADQLHNYVRDQIRESPESAWNWDFSEIASEAERLKNIGREIQDQVLGMTRSTLKRALSNIDVEFNEGGDYRYGRIENEDMSGKNMSSADFRRAVLIKTNCSGTNLANADLRKARLEECDLSGTNLDASDLRKAIFNKTNLTGTNLGRSDMRRVSIYHCDMKGTNLSKANLDGARLVSVHMQGANLSKASTRGLTLHDVTLEGVVMPDGTPYSTSIDLGDYGITLASHPVPPLPPIPPAPPRAAHQKPKRGMRVTIVKDDDADELDELEEEMDALETEMDDLDAELDDIQAHIGQEKDKARAEIEKRRAELEKRRAQIEAELADLEDDEI